MPVVVRCELPSFLALGVEPSRGTEWAGEEWAGDVATGWQLPRAAQTSQGWWLFWPELKGVSLVRV